MAELLNKIRSWVSLLPPVTITSLVEIVIIAVFVYELLLWIKKTRAWQLLKGLLVIAAAISIAAILRLTTIMWLLERISTAAIIAMVVIFQPELRRALEQIGSRNFLTRIFPENNQDRTDTETVNEIVKATFAMAKVKTGALIVMERTQALDEIEDTGIRINGIVSAALLINIFEKNTPLHDGAVVISGDKVTAATCYLPLSDREISKDFGTRHRAALGISEQTDSITVVVSEETGKVSVASQGELVRIKDAEELRAILPGRTDGDNAASRNRFHLFRNVGEEAGK